MKKILLTAVCATVLTLSAGFADAQPAPAEVPMGPGPVRMHEPLSERLNLTDEQKQQAEKIREEGRKKMEPLMQERKLLREEMEQVRKENMEEFEKILTPEQKKVFDEMKQHKGPKPPRPGDHRRPGPKHHPRHEAPLPGDEPMPPIPGNEPMPPEPLEGE